jgi:hypothetical protein
LRCNSIFVNKIFKLISDRKRSGVRVVSGEELETTATRRSYIYDYLTEHQRFLFLDSSATHAAAIGVVATVAACRHQFTL